MAATLVTDSAPPAKGWAFDFALGACLTVTLATYAPKVAWLPTWVRILCLPGLTLVLAALVRPMRLGPLARGLGDYPTRGRHAWVVGAGLAAALLWVAIPVPGPTLPGPRVSARAAAARAAAGLEPAPRDLLLPEWARGSGRRAAVACAFVSLSFTLLLAGLWLSGLSLRAGPGSGWLGYAVCCACPWTVYLLVFWPGLMNADACGQWIEMTTWVWQDQQPAFHTFCNWLVTRLWLSPAAVALAQIVVLSAIVGWALARLRAWGLPRWLAAGICLAAALAPANGISAITVNKDTPFAAALLALTILVLEAVHSRGDWLRRRWAWVGLGLTVALVSVLRLNGALAAFGTLLALAVCYRTGWRRIAAAAALAAGLLAAVHGPFHRWLGVRSTPQRPGLNFVAMHHIAAHLAAGTPLKPGERALLDRLRPPPAAWPYYPSISGPLFFDDIFDWQAAEELSGQTMLLALKLDARAPATALKHLIASNSYLWRITEAGPEDKVWGICVGLTLDGRVWTMDAAYSHTAFAPDSKLPAWQLPVARWLQDSYRRPRLAWFFWRPALCLYLGLFAGLLAVVRARSWAWLLVLAPSLLNVASLALVGCNQLHRYGHPLQLVVLTIAPFLALAVPRAQAAAAETSAAEGWQGSGLRRRAA